MKFLLGLVILSHVDMLVRECIEILDKDVKDLLLGITAVEVFQELLLHIVEVLLDALALYSLPSKNLHHLALVGFTGLFPKGHENLLKLIFNVISLRNEFCRELGGLNLGTFVVGLALLSRLVALGALVHLALVKATLVALGGGGLETLLFSLLLELFFPDD